MLPKNKNPFADIAFSKYLLPLLLATVIWGLFPLPFFFMEGFESDFPSVYLLLRYLMTSMIFLIILFPLFSGASDSVRRFVSGHWKVFLYGGTMLFLARFFEVLAFRQGQRTFALIFCVALVPLTEPIAVYGLYRRRFCRAIFQRVFGEREAAAMRSIIHEKENYWFEYFLTLSLILSAAVFFIYARDGQIRIFPSDGSGQLFVYPEVLASALALQLYFHTYDFGFARQEDILPSAGSDSGDALSGFSKRLKPVLLKQTAFAVIAAMYCVLWNLSADANPLEAIRSVAHPVRFWAAFGIGIVVFGSVIAYTCENFSLDNYDREKSVLPFRIRGVEWGGIATFTDPLTASLLTAVFPVLVGGPAAHPFFFFLSFSLIVLLIILKIMILCHSRFHELKIFCFSHLRSQRTLGEMIRPDHFSSVALIRHLKRIRDNQTVFEMSEIRRFREGDAPRDELDEHLQTRVWLFNSNHLESRREIAVWILKNGRLAYNSKQLFERLLFHEHIRCFCAQHRIREGRILIFFPDKLKSDENALIRLMKDCTRIRLDEEDQVFYFLDIPEYENLSHKIQVFIQESLMIFKDRRLFCETQNEVMAGILFKG